MSATQDFVRKQITGDPFTKLVLRVVADYANWETGVCFPSIETLAADCECSESTVRRRLHDLQEQGFIKLELQSGRPNTITLVGYAEWFSSLPVRSFGRCVPQEGVSHSNEGVSHSNERGVHGTPEIYNINISRNTFNKKNENRITNCNSEEETRVRIENEKIKLCDQLNEYWLKLFDGQQDDLNLALLQVAAYVQPSRVRSLETQVSSQLSKIVRERNERKRNYQQIAKTKTLNGKPNFNGSKPIDPKDDAITRHANEFFARMERGDFK